MKYKVVETKTASELEIEVNRLMEQGWQPLGNLVVSKNKLHQVIIYEQAPKPPGSSE